MKDNKWIKGALILGFSFFISIFIIKPVGVSTQFSVLSGIIHNEIEDNLITPDKEKEYGYSSTNEYYDKSGGKIASHIENPLNYDFIFVLSIPLGGYLGYRLLKSRKSEPLQESCSSKDVNSCPVKENKKGFIKKYLPSFIGGFILLFGARMADGCTSGHMMSGMMQGSVSGYVFAASVFASAIPTAIILKNIKKKKG